MLFQSQAIIAHSESAKHVCKRHTHLQKVPSIYCQLILDLVTDHD